MSDQQLFFHMMRQVVEALGLEPNFLAFPKLLCQVNVKQSMRT